MWDVLFLALLARLLAGLGARLPALRLLAGASALWLAFDTVYALVLQYGSYDQGLLIDILWLLGFVLFGATGLHPSMAELTQRHQAGDRLLKSATSSSAATSQPPETSKRPRHSPVDAFVQTSGRCCRADQSGRDRGCRRPKRKYEMGTTPAEPTTVTTVAHTHFGPRTWLAGRRFRSMSAASLRIPSAAAVMASSLRVRPLRSLHCLLAAMPPSACTARSRWSHHTWRWPGSQPSRGSAARRLTSSSASSWSAPEPGLEGACGQHQVDGRRHGEQQVVGQLLEPRCQQVRLQQQRRHHRAVDMCGSGARPPAATTASPAST
jgi:hypothetical protein